MRLAVVLPLLTVPALAAAQPGPDDPTPPGLTPPIAVATPPPSPVDRADLDDAAADRAYGTSTALVVPSGRVDLSVRGGQGGVLFSAAVGFDHGIEISGQLGGITEAGLAGGDVKIAIARTRTWGLALDAGYHLVAVGDGGGGAFSFGGVTTYVSDSAVASFGAGVLGASGGSGAVYADASLVVGHGAFRPILEAASLDGTLFGFAGARLGNGHACLDLGVAGGGGSVTSSSGVGPLPLVGLTLRP